MEIAGKKNGTEKETERGKEKSFFLIMLVLTNRLRPPQHNRR